MFSRACEYAIRAVIFIAGQSTSGNRVSLRTIAEATGSPEAFTAKILQQLARHRIISSVKGPAGGFTIAPHQLEHITLSQVVTAIDGNKVFTGCGLGLAECSEIQPCPVHDKFKKIRNDLKQMLNNTTLLELSATQVEGLTFLKR